MKTISMLMLMVFAIASAQAQGIYNSTQEASYQDNWQYYYGKYQAYYGGVSQLAFNSDLNIPQNLKSKEKLIYHFKNGVKKEQASSISVYTYIDGKITNYKFYKKGKLKDQFSFEYNDNGFYTKYYTGPINHPKYEEQLVYNDSNRVVLYTTYNKKRRLNRKEVSKYDENQHLIRKDIYDGKHLNPKFSWVHKYDENGKRVETEHYKNGKLKTKWVFTCDDEGEKVESKDVKLTTTCSLVEYNNDGSYVKIYRNTDSKGRIRTSRWTYSRDSVIVAYETRNYKDKIIMKYTNEYDSQNNRIVYTYYKKGGKKLSHRTTFKYNSNKKITERISYNGKGKMQSKKQYTYDSKGNLIVYSVINSKGKMKWKNEYTYDKQGELIARLSYKNNKPHVLRNVVFSY